MGLHGDDNDFKLLALLHSHSMATPGSEWAEENFLTPIYNGDLKFAPVYADWLEDNGHSELSAQLRAATSPAVVRARFAAMLAEEMRNEHLPYFDRPNAPSRLDAARLSVGREASKLFPGFCTRQVANVVQAVNDFVRTKMLEDGFYRRIMPPVDIGSNELDLAFDTLLPVKVLDS